MMDEFLVYSRLVLHLVTAAILMSYRCNRTTKPMISILAALLAGISLALAIHGIVLRPESHQLITLLITSACLFVVARSRGNLAKALKLRKVYE